LRGVAPFPLVLLSGRTGQIEGRKSLFLQPLEIKRGLKKKRFTPKHKGETRVPYTGSSNVNNPHSWSLVAATLKVADRLSLRTHPTVTHGVSV